jgi:hypothetical protein
MRPTAEAAERQQQEEAARKAAHDEVSRRALMDEIRDSVFKRRLDEASAKIRAAAEQGKNSCSYALGERGVTRCHSYHSLFGYKNTLSRRHLDSGDQDLYDYLRSRGFTVEVVNVNARYPNSYWYEMLISW